MGFISLQLKELELIQLKFLVRYNQYRHLLTEIITKDLSRVLEVVQECLNNCHWIVGNFVDKKPEEIKSVPYLVSMKFTDSIYN